MVKLLNIALGGAAGAILRYWVSGLTYRYSGGGFPWGTLAVNLIGSLAIGFLWGISEAIALSQNMRLLVFIGILGSFTTFSTFSLENFHLLRDGEYWFVFGNVMASVILGMALVFVGFFISKSIIGIVR